MKKSLLGLALIGGLSLTYAGIILEESYIENGVKQQKNEFSEKKENLEVFNEEPKKIKSKFKEDDDIILDKNLNVEAPIKQIEEIKSNPIVQQKEVIEAKPKPNAIAEQFSKVKVKEKDTLVLDKNYGEKKVKKEMKAKVEVNHTKKEVKVISKPIVKHSISKNKNVKLIKKSNKIEKQNKKQFKVKHNIKQKHIKTKTKLVKPNTFTCKVKSKTQKTFICNFTK